MICFFTSSPCVQGASELNPANGFTEELQRRLPNPCRTLFVTAEPDLHDWTEMIAGFTRESFEAAGIAFSSYHILERETMVSAREWIEKADLVILAGGHVPTENRFFSQLGLRELLRNYHGVVLGISAGTMNCAGEVYAQPEKEEEVLDPNYRKFLPGLGLTNTMILPHYQEVRDSLLAGKRLYEEITLPDSFGRTFYALVDGSYVFSCDGREELRGEAYLIRDGQLRQLSRCGEKIPL